MTITTENLHLRPFALEDKDFILELLTSPGWLKFIGDRGVKNLEDAEKYLVNGPLKSYETHQFGLSMVELKDGTRAGMCGLIKRDGLKDVDLGFAFLPRFAGKGYTTEIAKATLDHAFRHLNQPRVVAITDPENAGSIRVLKKSGMMEEGRLTLPDDTKELLLFSIENPYKAPHFPGKHISLESERLLLRQLNNDDAPELLELFTWSAIPAKNTTDVVRILKKTELAFAHRLGVNWGIVQRDTGKIIGNIGYYRGFPGQCGEVGFVLKEAFRRNGYMEEALRLVLKFGYEELKLKKIIALTRPDNKPCQGLLLKTNFTFVTHNEKDYFEYTHNTNRHSSPRSE